MGRLGLLAVFVTSCTLQSVNGQALTLVYNKGDVYDYSLHVVFHEDQTQGAMNTLPINGDLTAHEKVTVLSVGANGTADVTVQLFDIVVKNDPRDLSPVSPSLPAQGVRIAPDGRILSLSGTNIWPGPFPSGRALGGNLFSSVLPLTAVKPGDTWSNQYDESLPFNFPPFHIATRSKYVRDESFQGVNAAVVGTTTEISADFATDSSHRTKGTSNSDVITWIDPKTHRILKSHMSSRMEATLTYTNASGPNVSLLKTNETADLLPFKA